MFITGLLEYGHQTVLKSIEGIEGENWESGKVVGEWSAKDVLNHLTSMEHIFLDVLKSAIEKDTTTPYLDGYLSKGPHVYCNEQVEAHRPNPITATLQEFEEVHAQVMATVEQLDPTLLSQKGTLSWYGGCTPWMIMRFTPTTVTKSSMLPSLSYIVRPRCSAGRSVRSNV